MSGLISGYTSLRLDYRESPVCPVCVHCCTGVLSCVVFTKPPYEVRETGWGEFEIQIKIYFQDSAEKPVSGG